MAVLAQDLRDAVLQYALQGKLTEQLDSDSSVEDLLAKIKAEKEQLIKNKKIKKEKPLPEIEDDEIPYDIPNNWRWERVGNIADCGAGATPSRSNSEYYKNGNISWLKTGELNNSYITETEEYITEKALRECSLRLNKIGDILIAMYGATIGKLGIVTYPLTTNQACCGCTPFGDFYNLYLFYYFMGIKNVLVGKAEGGAQPNISREKIRNSLIPVPPVEEQIRIVSKIEEVLEKVEEYKVIEDTSITLKKAFPMDMHDALLQAAMQGKLTEQLDTDSSVDDLIEQIKVERQKLEAEGKIKKSKGKKSQQNDYFVELSKDEYPYEVPSNWRWTTLEEITIPNKGQGLTKSDIDTGNIPVILYGQLYTTYKNKITKVVSHASEESIRKSFKVDSNDIILPLTSTSPKAEIGKGVIYSSNETTYLGSDILCLKHFINSEFLMLLINNPMFSRQKMNFVNGITIKHLNVNKFLTIPIAIPPIEEQQRIVETLDRLLPLCEAL